MRGPFDETADCCLRRCDELALASETAGEITRTYLTPAMAAAHRLVGGWMRAAGLVTRVDGAGNLVGRWEAADPAAKTLLIGSHLDTVPNGGRFDGALGVMIGLSVVETLKLAGDALPFHVDVIGFSEEEGVRFRQPYFGSAAVAGRFEEDWLERLDAGGVTVRRAIEAFGLSVDQIELARYEPSNVVGFIEPHIEQGPVLGLNDQPVGVVSAIAGQTRGLLRWTGDPAHAGTTPMSVRRDALVAASRWIARVQSVAARVDDLRATVGSVEVLPGARNVIPGVVVTSLDVRHPVDLIREQTVATLLHQAGRCAERAGVALEFVDKQDQPAAVMDTGLVSALVEAAGGEGLSAEKMISGAGHDAVVMADHVPTAMLFVRQRDGGVSHHPDESVHRDDVAAAIGVLVRCLRSGVAPATPDGSV